MKMIFIRINLVVLILFIAGCSRSWDSKLFSFPPESKPHENNWSYIGEIKVYHLSGKPPITSGKKKMIVNIYDKFDNNLLNEEIEIVGGIFDHKIEWSEFENLKIETYEKTEEGKKFVNELVFHFDGKMFVQ